MLARIAGRRITGRPATPERLEAARRALLGLQLFDSVRAEPARALDPGGNLPVTFVLRERPRRAFGISAGWETVFGPTLSAYWEHRNLFGGAEALRIEAEGSRVGASGGFADGTYRLAARLRTPEVLRRDIRMEARVQAARERLEAFDRNALILSALFDHRLNERTTLRAGPGLTIGEVGRDGDVTPVRRFDLTLAIRYDDTDSPLDPTRGWRLAATALPTLPLDGDGRFARLRLDGSTYLALDATAATVLALRAAAGTSFGETRDGLALDARFYAGGGGSVRGLPFQGIGARDSRGRPLGGASLLEGSVELRRRLTETLGVVGFVDAGAVGEGRWPHLSGVRVGAGLGIRYLTAIGPLRADVAVPLNRRPGDPAFGVYIGLGQAFCCGVCLACCSPCRWRRRWRRCSRQLRARPRRDRASGGGRGAWPEPCRAGRGDPGSDPARPGRTGGCRGALAAAGRPRAAAGLAGAAARRGAARAAGRPGGDAAAPAGRRRAARAGQAAGRPGAGTARPAAAGGAGAAGDRPAADRRAGRRAAARSLAAWRGAAGRGAAGSHPGRRQDRRRRPRRSRRRPQRRRGAAAACAGGASGRPHPRAARPAGGGDAG
jgi:hypothetical protein